MTTTTSTSRRSSSRAELVADQLSGPEPRSERSVTVWCSVRADGDFHPGRVSAHELERRRRSVVDVPWTMPDHRHGTEVVIVRNPGDGDGRRGDIAVTDLDDAVLATWVADCAPLVLVGADREFAVVHAGWKGLAAGVIDAAFAAITEPVVEAMLGPTIHPCCYEFGAGDLAAVAAGVHAPPARVGAITSGGRPALDVPAAVEMGCARHGVAVARLAGCTGCAYDGFSHRVRADPQRQVVAAWRSSGSRP